MRMTTKEATRHMREHTPLNQVMIVLLSEAARLEQDGMQRCPSSPIEVRAMMLDGATRILDMAVEVGLVIRNDAEPTESEQGLIPIPDGYAEQ